MNKKKQKNKKILLILFIVFMSVISSVFLIKVFYQPIKTYHSDFLKTTINYPRDFELDEKFGLITLKNNANEAVTISRIGTNNDSIEGFLFDLSDRNKVQISSKKKLNINGYEFMSVVINHPLSKTPDTKVYYFYRENFVYSISTKYPELYDDLDFIAKSFRYEP